MVLPWPTAVSHPYAGSGTTAQWSCPDLQSCVSPLRRLWYYSPVVLPWPTVVSHPYAGSGTTAQWSCPDLQSCLTPTQALVLQPSDLALTNSRVSPLRRLWHYSPVVLPWHTAVSHPYAGSGTTAQWSCPDLQSCLTPTQALVLQPSRLALTYRRVSALCRLWYYSPVVLPWPTVVSQPYAGSGTTAQWSCPDLQSCLSPTQALVLQLSGLALTYSRVSPLRRLWYYRPVVLPWPTVVSQPYVGSGTTAQWSCPDLQSCLTPTQPLVLQPSGLALTYSRVSALRRLWYYSPVVLPWPTVVSHPYAGSGTTTQWSCPDPQSRLTPAQALVLQPNGLALTYSRVSPLRWLWYYSPVGLALTYSRVSPLRRLWYYSPVVLPWPTVVSHPYAGSGTTAQWSCPDLQPCLTPTLALVLQPSGLALTYSRVSPLCRLWYYSPVVLPWPTVVSHPYAGSGTTGQWSCPDLQSCLSPTQALVLCSTAQWSCPDLQSCPTPTQALVLQPSGLVPDLQSCLTPTQPLVLQPSGLALTYSRVSALRRLWYYVVQPSGLALIYSRVSPLCRLWYYFPVVLPWPTVVSHPYAASGTTAQWSCPDLQSCLTPTQPLVLQPSGLALTYSRVSPYAGSGTTAQWSCPDLQSCLSPTQALVLCSTAQWSCPDLQLCLTPTQALVLQPSGLALTYSRVSPIRSLWYYSPVVLPWQTAVSHPYAGSGTTAQWSCPDLQSCLTPTQPLVLQPSGLALTYSRVSPLRRLWYYSPVVLPWQTAVSHPYAGSGTTA